MSDGPDLARLYGAMVRMRVFEESLAHLWRRGLISGELHLGVGEEAIMAGVIDHLHDGDALALDYRPTPAIVARGVEMESIVLEVLGHEEGLGSGRGGHMHLLDRGRLIASTGIVGSPAPIACGLALAADRLRPGSVAVAFFGDGAVNQGMVMESWNLARVWRLPVVFVVKDNGWAASTRSDRLRAGSITDRARSFGLATVGVDGNQVVPVWHAARSLVSGARKGRPGVLVARCRRPTGHMLDDTISRTVRSPAELLRLSKEMVRSQEGMAGARGVLNITATVLRALADRALPHRDPVTAVARMVGKDAEGVREAVHRDVEQAVNAALARAGAAP